MAVIILSLFDLKNVVANGGEIMVYVGPVRGYGKKTLKGDFVEYVAKDMTNYAAKTFALVEWIRERFPNVVYSIEHRHSFNITGEAGKLSGKKDEFYNTYLTFPGPNDTKGGKPCPGQN